ncbi:MAG: glycosyltransferase, partial [Bacteroidales bacterium]|nr:glycosyltransferase [Bacteroidales bacterium]
MKRRIAYLVSTLRRTGPTHQLLYLLSHLNAQEFEPLVITLSPEPDDSMMETFLDLGIPVYTLGQGRLSGMVMGRLKLERMISDLKPDLLHTQGLRPDLLGLSLGGRPVVSTQRNDPFLDYPAK